MFMSTNEPENFSWHDAEIKSVYCENRKMIWKVSRCIECFDIEFSKFRGY